MDNLVDAIYLENVDMVKNILEHEPSKIDEVDEHGVLMALLAAKTGNLKLVRYIVEYSRASMQIFSGTSRDISFDRGYESVHTNGYCCRE